MFKINSGIGLSLLCVFVLHNFAFDQANVFRDGAQIFFLVLFFLGFRQLSVLQQCQEPCFVFC